MGEIRLIDEFKVEVGLKFGCYKLQIPCLNVRDAMIRDPILEIHEDLLKVCIWWIAKLQYDPENAPKGRPWQRYHDITRNEGF